MINYKGIFYNENKEKKYYEGGAHFKYMDLVYEADGVTQRGGNKLMGKSGLLHSWSEYKQSYPEYYNNTTKKFWWQTNTTMNTIISTYHKEDDPNGYYKI